MKAIVTGLLMVLVMMACETVPQAQPATDQEMDAAFKAMFDCLETFARKMDDGTSDASSVALGVQGMCRREFNRTIEVGERGLNPVARRTFEKKVQPENLLHENAVQMVLKVRKDRKRPQ
jgi:hypothetical protein